MLTKGGLHKNSEKGVAGVLLVLIVLSVSGYYYGGKIYVERYLGRGITPQDEVWLLKAAMIAGGVCLIGWAYSQLTGGSRRSLRRLLKRERQIIIDSLTKANERFEVYDTAAKDLYKMMTPSAVECLDEAHRIADQLSSRLAAIDELMEHGSYRSLREAYDIAKDDLILTPNSYEGVMVKNPVPDIPYREWDEEFAVRFDRIEEEFERKAFEPYDYYRGHRLLANT